MPIDQYSIEQAEEDIARLRGDLDRIAQHFRSVRVIAMDPTTTFASPADESWHTLGSLGAHYTVNYGRFRLTTDNCVEIDFSVQGDGLQAGTVNWGTTLPAAYKPSLSHTALPLGSTRAVTAADVWPRWAVSNAGVVSVTVTPVAGITYSTSGAVKIPLD